MSWPEPVARVAAVLTKAAVDSRIEQFDEGTPTARAAAEAVGCELAQIVKSLVFVCDGSYVLALVPGDRRADEKVIAAALAAESIRIATADEVMAATGFEPGGVAPFPQLAVSRTLMDRSFLQHQVVWVGAGTERHMAALPPLELARLTRASAIDL
jgi:Cys-tRNA(Pro) deacylase